MEKFEFIPFGLSIEDVYILSTKPYNIQLSQELEKKIKESRKLWKETLREKPRNHDNYDSVKFKNSLTPEEIRAIMILQAYSLALGYSGVRIEVVEKILEFLRKNIIPLIPENLSLKRNLNPLIFIVYALKGKGEVLYKNKRMKTEKALKESNTKYIDLEENEILALTSGTQYIAGILSIYFIKIKKLGKLSEIAFALFLENLRIEEKLLNSFIYALKPHLGLIKFYENLRKLLKESEFIFSSDNPKSQNLYILNNLSQVFFIFHQTIDFMKNILETEINSISNSPIIIPKEKFILYENLYVETLSHIIDYLSIVIANLSYLLEKIIDIIKSKFELDFPSLYAIYQNLSKENKKLSKPSNKRIFCLNKYDFIKLEIKNIIKLKKIVKNWEKLITINFVYATHGIDYYKPLKCGKGTEIAYQFIKSLISPIKDNLHKIKILEENLDKLLRKVEEEIGELF
ncbi:MAG: aromatic amino acid lyase [Dictyoglomus sp.]|nr:aromatic amino acid lyase [Dictyoglomus sp.]MCX7942422.1 aromatic amino acid lyase [Dictyoglomaceae bacterium]MDW8187685.1 aromatic amino acid lyase [Dictyoglomus sp.]